MKLTSAEVTARSILNVPDNFRGKKADLDYGDVHGLMARAIEADRANHSVLPDGSSAVRQRDLDAAVRVLNSPSLSQNVGELYNALRSIVGFAERPPA